jgi:quinol monooxygenase YgiN
VYKFIITIQLQPGTRDEILARAPAAQAATRAEPGCISYDFFTCTDDPDRLVFVEAWTSKEAHDWHMEQEPTQAWIAFHEPKHRTFLFETINVKP